MTINSTIDSPILDNMVFDRLHIVIPMTILMNSQMKNYLQNLVITKTFLHLTSSTMSSLLPLPTLLEDSHMQWPACLCLIRWRTRLKLVNMIPSGGECESCLPWETQILRYSHFENRSDNFELYNSQSDKEYRIRQTQSQSHGHQLILLGKQQMTAISVRHILTMYDLYHNMVGVQSLGPIQTVSVKY